MDIPHVGTGLRTARLELRPLGPDDGDAFFAIWGDPEVIWWGPYTDRAASDARLGRVLARCAAMPLGLGWWLVRDRVTGAPLGDVVLQPAPFAPGQVELGYHFARRAWGRGMATEAGRAIVAHAFDALGLGGLVAVVALVNPPSQRVIARLGFHARAVIPWAGLPHVLYEKRR